MKKITSVLLSFAVLGAVVAIIVSDMGCTSAITPCPSGEASCGAGCMPTGNVCCGDTGSCSPGYTCGSGGSCIFNNPCAGCLSQGMACCTNNSDNVIDCAPVGTMCCGNHRFCAAGFICGGTCPVGSCCR